MANNQKLLLVCSDISAFNFAVKYSLKDKFKLYSSDECKKESDDIKKAKLKDANLVIIDGIHDKDDLKLINVAEYRKVAVLREHESRQAKWANCDFFKAEAVCKYKNYHLLQDAKDIDTLIKNLKSVELEIDDNWRYYGKKCLKVFLFCLNLSN